MGVVQRGQEMGVIVEREADATAVQQIRRKGCCVYSELRELFA